tara:strand:+ start:590 stop:814 length:225 start_codon:yes stop_codon:yes gene_type:complete
MSELASIAAAIKARGETPHPVEPAEMEKVLEFVMTLGFKLGVNEGMKYENGESMKQLKSITRETKRRNRTPWYS